jgi:hypothetical protein
LLSPSQLAKRILLGIVAILLVLYIGDFISVRVRMLHPKPGDPFETITAFRIIAISEKGNKTEYDVDPVQPQQSGECAHSLFPQHGDPPCWYLKHKFAQPIPMTLLLVPKQAR